MNKTIVATGTELLARVGWLSEVPADFAARILAIAKWREVAAGQTITYAGDEDGSLVGVARGSVTVSTALGMPDMPIIHVSQPGQWYGYLPLFGYPRHQSITARSDVLIAICPEHAVLSLVAEVPEYWRHLGRLGIINLNTAVNVVADLMIRDSRRRVIAALLRLAEERFENGSAQGPHEVPLSQDELAAMTNLSRTSVSDILHALEADALIRLGYRTVLVRNAPQLRAMLESA